ncbi:Formyltetrahydrofolate deformylase [Bosea sp. 62]|uniref:formyltetrahydrofolate deformylase n=1 Tax=unclassified Bosea (in: a-proteobacteria) TaxID=2653178 RepID=UPI001254033D|nr:MULTISPECIES: formyltetrahydrofolate deformylase [unclassified Bosea (in: a-proteobacteria)]CAD5249173.1 Formyltetrahydrofolate deformylase [Bosea sp. 46]CAD5250166.1 Formyltetrahydrofolate deformylase [Bosea sp. 21B]CAD5265468.1 Formyltetrahydrofolate deformylase [Bosea sp. 7B]VVT44514.1 Formyltetrahydrofolate deformylase [Bosea sp. EC-HK365B]VXB07702.1 Formyltetrahydrofolate deformylase [Bosea sp. 29B]
MVDVHSAHVPTPVQDFKVQKPDRILTLSCEDRPGIVHAVSGVLYRHGCNILESAQFSDPRDARFFMRVAFATGEGFDKAAFKREFDGVAGTFRMEWDAVEAAAPARVLLMVSRFGHCLNDLLFRQATGNLNIEIPAIVSNHRDFEALARSYDIPFHYLPVTPVNKAEQEARLLEIVAGTSSSLVVLARYMQVLSNDLCRALDGRAINIHHSFLPSFKGAKPYHQAYDRGVKLIGATAHYVTPDLDEGPIIDQDVARAEHSLAPDDLVSAGRDIEAVVLARALRLHIERRVMLAGRRTVIFR